MKLLLDHHLSPKLAGRLTDLCPCEHVAAVGLERAKDSEVWAYAEAHGLTVVTKDVDFVELATLRGTPPRVVWLRLGNSTTAEVEAALRRHHGALVTFHADPDRGVLELRRANDP